MFGIYGAKRKIYVIHHHVIPRVQGLQLLCHLYTFHMVFIFQFVNVVNYID